LKGQNSSTHSDIQSYNFNQSRSPKEASLSLKRSWTVAWMEMESEVLALETAQVEKSDLLESASWYF